MCYMCWFREIQLFVCVPVRCYSRNSTGASVWNHNKMRGAIICCEQRLPPTFQYVLVLFCSLQMGASLLAHQQAHVRTLAPGCFPEEYFHTAKDFHWQVSLDHCQSPSRNSRFNRNPHLCCISHSLLQPQSMSLKQRSTWNRSTWSSCSLLSPFRHCSHHSDLLRNFLCVHSLFPLIYPVSALQKHPTRNKK